MKTIVITGSTRGIGLGLAKEFLARDCQVVISGRSKGSVSEVVELLEEKNTSDRIYGFACDVSKNDQVEELWKATIERFAKIDIWINNAGIGHVQEMIWNLPASTAKNVVETNIMGVIHGSQVAVRGMEKQGFGALYNMEGMGSTGRKHDGLSLYGASKYYLKYLSDSLISEAKNLPIIIGTLSPGMVITDLILDQFIGREDELEESKKIFNIIADRVENVTPWLVERVLENRKTGVRFAWITGPKMLFRFLTAPFTKRNVFLPADGVE